MNNAEANDGPDPVPTEITKYLFGREEYSSQPVLASIARFRDSRATR
jgi:hypothetical protein